MYLELGSRDANQISFPDCAISSFASRETQISFNSDGIFIEGVGFVGPDADVKCVIYGSIHLREYVDSKWVDIDLSPVVGLREICEWNAGENGLIFAGFESRSGQWAEYNVSDFSMNIRISHG